MKLKDKLFGLIGFSVAGLMMFSCTELKEANYQIIPMPLDIQLAEKGKFVLAEGTPVIYPEGNEKMQNNANFLAEYVKEKTGIALAPTTGTEGKGIVLKVEENKEKPEGYMLKVTSDNVVISGGSEAGVFYGIQTLRKSLPVVQGEKVALPAVEINDAPRFNYRGGMLDVSRHYIELDSVKRFIDMLAMHNINRFHWHLSEDQGWRIEIKCRPLLTEKGSMRKETVIGRTGKYDGKPHGGFYTQEQAKEIVAYAAERYITVIPEIDMPGHMLSALHAYPELGCTGGPYEVWCHWGVSKDVLCAGNDATLKFIEDVLGEIVEIFPSEYIHVGGDECPKTRWESCPKCQARIKALGIKGDEKHSAEEYLQSFVINHAEKFLNSKGRQIIGWDEILEGGLAPNATVMSWRGEEGGIEAARQKHKAIMTPHTYLYFDYYQSYDTKNEPLAIGGRLPLERVYGYEPMPKMLSAEEQKYIVGVQANLWTEYISTFRYAEYMLLPRLAALSEIQWSSADKRNYECFLSRLPRMAQLYDLKQYNYAGHAFDITANLVPDSTAGVVKVAFKTIDNCPIHYTLDGSEPTAASPLYTDTLMIKEACTISAVGIRPARKTRLFTETVNIP
ncbi:MAG: family 20 glycosylhydrolase [Bacteroidaceae bacterium]|nr:family 20 glycosylhydrolase [Bacteroidaceae bacterium]